VINAQIQPLLAAAQANPGMARPRIEYEPTSPRLLVDIDREKAATMGVTPAAVGDALQALFGSERITTYIKSGQEYDVIVQSDRPQRMNERDLSKVYVRAASGSLVPLTSLTKSKVSGDTPSRNRVDRQRAITLSVQLNPGYSVGEAVRFFEARLKDMPGVNYKWGGSARDYLEAGGSVGLAFGMALLLVFLVLAAQFESWIHPAVIMLTVPIAALGGLFGLLIAGSTMNTYSQIGLIILVGIAAKNGILIVEFANQLRDQGLSIREAVIESSSLRLRPIIMTSISAAAGAIPLIVWGGAGGESGRTIGVTIFFGRSSRPWSRCSWCRCSTTSWRGSRSRPSTPPGASRPSRRPRRPASPTPPNRRPEKGPPVRREGQMGLGRGLPAGGAVGARAAQGPGAAPCAEGMSISRLGRPGDHAPPKNARQGCPISEYASDAYTFTSSTNAGWSRPSHRR
jgi:hypothetical protein